MSPARLRAVLVALCTLALADLGTDPMLAGDPIDPSTGWPMELLPGLPALDPGPDSIPGTADDALDPSVVGDVDLVVRSGAREERSAFALRIARGEVGMTDPDFAYCDVSGDGDCDVADAFVLITDPIGVPSVQLGLAPLGTAEPFGNGVPVPYEVFASDGTPDPPHGAPVTETTLDGTPVLVGAFPDLDDDGIVGPTRLDGDPTDDPLEEAELIPVGLETAIADAGQVRSALDVGAGGPAASPLRVVLGAAAFAGTPRAAYFGGILPEGPAVFTALPFAPETVPSRILLGELVSADPEFLLAVAVRQEFTPTPTSPLYGEAFALPTGGGPSIDAAEVRSGAFVRFGVLRRPDPSSYRADPMRPLRPGVDASGQRVVLELIRRLDLAHDGPASRARLRIAPLDRLGNVADLAAPSGVRIRSRGPVQIVAPDMDGDPYVEDLVVRGAVGVEVVLESRGDEAHERSGGALVVESPEGVYLLEVDLVDPDPDR